MTQHEAVEAVRGYLAHTGGSEAKQIWLGLEREVTPAQIRSAFKALGAVAARSWNAWPTLIANPVSGFPGRIWATVRFTSYRLPASGGAR